MPRPSLALSMAIWILAILLYTRTSKIGYIIPEHTQSINICNIPYRLRDTIGYCLLRPSFAKY